MSADCGLDVPNVSATAATDAALTAIATVAALRAAAAATANLCRKQLRSQFQGLLGWPRSDERPGGAWMLCSLHRGRKWRHRACWRALCLPAPDESAVRTVSPGESRRQCAL